MKHNLSTDSKEEITEKSGEEGDNNFMNAVK